MNMFEILKQLLCSYLSLIVDLEIQTIAKLENYISSGNGTLLFSKKYRYNYKYLEMCLLRKRGFCHMYKSGLIYSFAFQIDIRNCYNRNSKQTQTLEFSHAISYIDSIITACMHGDENSIVKPIQISPYKDTSRDVLNAMPITTILIDAILKDAVSNLGPVHISKSYPG